MEKKTALADLLAPFCELPDMPQCQIQGITADSRQVKPGYLFIASCEPLGDGEPHIQAAILQGAAAVIKLSINDQIEVRYVPSDHQHTIPEISLPDLAPLIGTLAARYYGQPSEAVPVIGVTGTNGKTTISFLLAQALTALEQPSSVIGTVGYGPPAQLQRASLTTPMPVDLQQILASEVALGTKAITMEVSSHSLAQHRVNGIHFDTAVFTNLTRDHLDYHGSMEQYGLAKKALFTWPGLKTRIINLDDAFGLKLAREFINEGNVIAYSVDGEHELALPIVEAKQCDYMANGTYIIAVSPWGELQLQSPLLGEFNVSNVLAVVAVLGNMGYKPAQIEAIIPDLVGAPGRMQVVTKPGQPLVLIDYAHTAGALEAALLAIKQHNRGKIFCVFGCGGNRDTGKRSLMGQVAAEFSDIPVVTSDNPRFEPPQAIIDDILCGIKRRTDLHVEVDRRIAIGWALDNASADDIVLIAGKGHEDYQQIDDIFHHFSDYEEVMSLMNAK